MPSYYCIKEFTKFLSTRQDWVGLDVGCGEHFGVLAEYGLDAAPIKKCVIPDYPMEKFTQGDIFDMPFEDNSFDYVVSAHTIEHLKDGVSAVKEMARVAKLMVIANVPRYTRHKSEVKGCVSLDFYHFSHFPENMAEFGLTRNDFPVWSEGATVFAGYEAPHVAWYPEPEDLKELFKATDCFDEIRVEVCPDNCGELNVYAKLKKD